MPCDPPIARRAVQTVSIDKSQGVQVILNNESLAAQVLTSKCSEVPRRLEPGLISLPAPLHPFLPRPSPVLDSPLSGCTTNRRAPITPRKDEGERRRGCTASAAHRRECAFGAQLNVIIPGEQFEGGEYKEFALPEQEYRAPCPMLICSRTPTIDGVLPPMWQLHTAFRLPPLRPPPLPSSLAPTHPREQPLPMIVFSSSRNGTPRRKRWTPP